MLNKVKSKVLFFSITIIVCLLVGCGAGPYDAVSDKTMTAPITLEVEVFDRGNAPDGTVSADNNYTTRLIQSVWGNTANVTIKYVPVPRAQEEEKLSLMLSSAAAPDIVFTYTRDLYYKYAQEGYLSDLTDYIDKTEHLKALVNKNSGDILYNGRYYGAIAYRPQVDRHNSFIRTDWLQELGLETPATTDEWYTVMKAFKEKSPGGAGGEIIPFGLRATNYVDNHYGAQHLLWSFVKATDEELQILPYLMLPGFRDGVSFLNKMYHEGLIDPDFDLDVDEKNFKTNITNGSIGFVTLDSQIIYDYSYGDLLDNLQSNVSGAILEPVECFMNPEGKYLKSVYPHCGMFIMVPKTSNEAEIKAAIDFLDWQSSDEGLKLLKWGEPRRNYTLADGIPIVSAEQENINRIERFNVFDLSLMWNGAYNINENLLFRQIEVSDNKWGKQRAASIKMSMQDGFRDYNANPAFETNIDAVGKYQTNLDKLYLEGLAKVIKGSPSEFNYNYDGLVSSYLDNGGQQIIDQKKAAYKTMRER